MACLSDRHQVVSQISLYFESVSFGHSGSGCRDGVDISLVYVNFPLRLWNKMPSTNEVLVEEYRGIQCRNVKWQRIVGEN